MEKLRNGNGGQISEYVQAFDRGGRSPDPGVGEDGPVYQITYAPHYEFSGGQPTRDDLVGAERMSQREFNRMMDQWAKDRSRTKF